MEPQIKAFSTQDKLARTRCFMGGYWTFLATSEDTNGQFSLIEMNLRKGLEPPRHTHTYEDESFYILAGEVHFFIEEEEYQIKAGQFLYIPKGTAHNFKLITDTAKILTQLTPGGLEGMFLEMSTPALVMDFPPMPSGPPPAEWIQKIHLLQNKYGIIGIDNSKIKAT